MDVSVNASASASANLSLTTSIMIPSFTAVSSAARPSAFDDSDSDLESDARPIQGPIHSSRPPSALPVNVPVLQKRNRMERKKVRSTNILWKNARTCLPFGDD